MSKTISESEMISSLFESSLNGHLSEPQLKPNKKMSVTSVNAKPLRGTLIGWMPDFPREMIIPREEPAKMIALISKNRIEKLKSNAKSLTKDKEEEINNKIKTMEERRRLCNELTEKIQAYDKLRSKEEKTSELEEEEKQKIFNLRQKAFKEMLEQTEEIKEINQLILNAKVQAIRDSQVIEKELIKEEHKKAELTLDEKMEKERQEALERERKHKEELKEKALKAAEQLQMQIKDNLEARLLQQDKQTREREKLLKDLEKQQEKEIIEFKNYKLKQRAYLEELLKVNEEILKHKERIKEEAKKEDALIAAIQKQKAEEEEAKENQEREARRKRELGIEKLGEQQKLGAAIKAENEARRIRRAQEEKERIRRKKEKEKILRNKQIQEDLKKSRLEQLETYEKKKREEAEKNEKELKAQLDKIKIELAKEQQEKLEKRKDNLKYSEEIRKQISNKEKQKIAERKQFFLDGIHLQQEEEKRHQMAEFLKKQKLKELEKCDIPKTYINHIKRKVNLKE